MNNSTQKQAWTVYLFVSLTIILWASAFVGIRASLKGYSPGALALFRYFVASLCMLPLYLRCKNRQRINAKDFLRIIAAGFLGFTLYNLTLNYGEMTVPAGIASFIVSLIPVFVAILAVTFLGERLSFSALVGLLICVVGITVIAVGEHAGMKFDFGVLLTLVTAICGASYAVLQKSLVARFHPIQITTWAIWLGIIPLLYFLPQLLVEIPKASLHATCSVIYMGIFPGAIAYSLWTYVLSRLPASKTAVYLYAMPLIATLLGWLWLNEVPSSVSFVGGLIALVGTVIVHFSRVK